MTIDLELGMPARRPDLWDGLLAPLPPGATPAPLAPADPHALAEALREATHAGLGGVAGLTVTCADAAEVAAVLSAAVAALTGDDPERALASPDLARVTGLGRAAREAIRDVLARVEIPAEHLEATLDALPPQARAGLAPAARR